MEPGSNTVVGEKPNQVKQTRNIIFLLGATILVAILVVVCFLFILNSQKTKKTNFLSNNSTNPNSSLSKQTPQSAHLKPIPPSYDKNKARAIISNYISSNIQNKYVSSDLAKLDFIFSSNSVAMQWGLGKNETRVYAGFYFVPATTTVTRLIAMVFPLDSVSSLDGSGASAFIGRYFLGKENSPWNCSNMDKATICKSVWNTNTEKKGFRVTKLPTGNVILFNCSINQDSPLFKNSGDCFQQ